jgi:nickel transport system ATP-binding protein
MTVLLEVKDLKVRERSSGIPIVKSSSFQLHKGSCLAIVGESGSGKSVTCKSILKLNKPSLQQTGEILFNGEDLGLLSEKEMRKRRGRNICMIMQNGMSSFDPSCVVGVHLMETLAEHFDWSKSKMAEKLAKAMESVKLSRPREILNKYPHQLSGGMLQRLMISLAIVMEPDLIIADEPTTALDAISQFEAVEQFIQLQENLGSSMIFISHDLAVVKKIADNILVMKDGVIVERGKADHVFSEPQHEYTQFLIQARRTLSDHFRRIIEGEEQFADHQ